MRYRPARVDDGAYCFTVNLAERRQSGWQITLTCSIRLSASRKAGRIIPTSPVSTQIHFELSLLLSTKHSLPEGAAFFSLRAQRKRIKRKGSPAAETAPAAEPRNRRGKNSLRSNSLPLHPVPHPTARLSGKGPHCPRTHFFLHANLLPGQAFVRFGQLSQ
jgi:hypothetical protein